MNIRNNVNVWGGVIGIILLVLSSLSYADELIKVDKALKQIFKDADSFERQTHTLTNEQIGIIAEQADVTFGEAHAREVIQYTAFANGSIVGYAYEDRVIGKWGPIHYLVGLNPNISVKRVIILDYEEIRGRRIAKKRFLNQYRKKTIKNTLRLRRDINGISGATISSRSLTDGVRKTLNIHNVLLDTSMNN